jgi:polyisoprenoid-binding protein YceI
MNRFFTACALATLVLAAANGLAAGNSGQPAAVPAASTAPVPAGAYTLDKAHASLLFRVSHLAFLTTPGGSHGSTRSCGSTRRTCPRRA